MTKHTRTHPVQSPAGAHMKLRTKVRETKLCCEFRASPCTTACVVVCVRVCLRGPSRRSPSPMTRLPCVLCAAEAKVAFFPSSSCFSAAAVCLRRCDRTAHTSDKHLVHLVAYLHNLSSSPTDIFSCFKRSNSQDSMFSGLFFSIADGWL